MSQIITPIITGVIAVSYTHLIVNSSLVSSRAVQDTAECIRVPSLCALIIGKMMHAAELGITLSLDPDSSCLEPDLLLPKEDLLTVIGNLLENAIEEMCIRDRRM